MVGVLPLFRDAASGLSLILFANDPGDWCSIPGWVLPKNRKIVLNFSLLNTQHYKICIKGKVEQSRERSRALLYIQARKCDQSLLRTEAFQRSIWHRCRTVNAPWQNWGQKTPASVGPPSGRQAETLTLLSPGYSTGPCCPVYAIIRHTWLDSDLGPWPA